MGLGWGAYPTSYSIGIMGFSSAEVKSEWSHTSALLVCLRGEDKYSFIISEQVNCV
jgi:hypothetical protein